MGENCIAGRGFSYVSINWVYQTDLTDMTYVMLYFREESEGKREEKEENERKAKK